MSHASLKLDYWILWVVSLSIWLLVTCVQLMFIIVCFGWYYVILEFIFCFATSTNWFSLCNPILAVLKQLWMNKFNIAQKVNNPVHFLAKYGCNNCKNTMMCCFQICPEEICIIWHQVHCSLCFKHNREKTEWGRRDKNRAWKTAKPTELFDQQQQTEWNIFAKVRKRQRAEIQIGFETRAEGKQQRQKTKAESSRRK